MNLVFLDADSFGADVIIVNKVPINAQTVGQCEHLRLICVTATGTNNLDKDFLRRRGIEWRNVAGYSTENVAQHTFALLFYLWEKLRYYDDFVKSGQHTSDHHAAHCLGERGGAGAADAHRSGTGAGFFFDAG